MRCPYCGDELSGWAVRPLRWAMAAVGFVSAACAAEALLYGQPLRFALATLVTVAAARNWAALSMSRPEVQ